MSTSQSEIVAGENVAGRDIHIASAAKIDRILESLYRRYKEAPALTDIKDKIVSDLSAYHDSVDGTPQTLAEKLSSEKHKALIKSAEQFKEYFRKTLEKFLHYSAAQEIYAHLLGEVSSLFHLHVLPLIELDAPLDQIMTTIDKSVVDKILFQIPDSEPTCNRKMILGMIYFLTGNCFISWQKC